MQDPQTLLVLRNSIPRAHLQKVALLAPYSLLGLGQERMKEAASSRECVFHLSHFLFYQEPFPLLQVGRRQRAATHPRSLTGRADRFAVLMNYSRSAPSYTSFELQSGKCSVHHACSYKEIRVGCI